MATTNYPTDAPTVAVRCPNCTKAYYDENYRGEPCRECGELL
jgi:hypothetical protein